MKDKEQTIEPTVEETKNDAVALSKTVGQIMAAPPPTSQQLRVMEVNEALAPAYQKASTLELTEAEINALTLQFPDDKIEIRPHDGLIYIPHIHISNRLNQVFNPGKWSLILRRHWLEGNTMYGEYILLIKGCYVGESVGGHPYQPNNPKTNYSDTLESTAAEALRRIAGKRLSCGSQVWDPEYARVWVEQHAGYANGKWFKKSMTVPKETAKTKANYPEKMKKFLMEIGDRWERATQFCIDLAWLMPNEPLSQLPERFLPLTRGDFKQFIKCMDRWSETGKAEKPYKSHEEDMPTSKQASGSKNVPGVSQSVHEGVEKDPPSVRSGTKEEQLPGIQPSASQEGDDEPFAVPGVRSEGSTEAPSGLRQSKTGGLAVQESSSEDPSEDEEWRSFPMPHGKHAGVKLEDLEKNYLYGLWANYTVETSFEKDGRTIRLKPETVAKNRKFRKLLDDAGLHYDFKKKD